MTTKEESNEQMQKLRSRDHLDPYKGGKAVTGSK